jgi:type IV pilus assembly protein PilW
MRQAMLQKRVAIRTQKGLTLIELLVSITVGLIILGVIASAYLVARQGGRTQDQAAQNAEVARVALELMRRQIQQAGYIDLLDTDPTTPGARTLSNLLSGGDAAKKALYERFPRPATNSPMQTLYVAHPNAGIAGARPMLGCDGNFNGNLEAWACAGAVSATRQSIQIAYQASSNAGATPPLGSTAQAINAATALGLDCAQQTPAGNAPVVINRFFLAQSDGRSNLMCLGNGNRTPQPVLAGVEELTFRYQIGSAASNTAAGAFSESYLSATQVAASTAGWPSVTGVEVCMIVATEPGRTAQAVGQAGNQLVPTCERDANGALLANRTVTGAQAARIYRRVISTISVRNAIYALPVL